MLSAGMVSVTFRALTPQEILVVTAAAGLQDIEWGSDLHVPVGSIEMAHSIGELTRQAGLRPISYGSYFFAGYTDETVFIEILRTAKALGARNIRIWAGKKGSHDEDDRLKVVRSVRQCAALCAKERIVLSIEYHINTLTDQLDSALRLIDEVAHENVRLYWQISSGIDDPVVNIRILRGILPYVSNVHVNAVSSNALVPLVEGEGMWRRVIDLLRQDGHDRSMLIEFTQNGSIEQFTADANTLCSWLYS